MEPNFLILNGKMARLWKSQFSKNDKILDIGCGSSPRYHKYIPSTVVCADKLGTESAHLLADAKALPFKPSSFDGVVSVNALYYCEEPRVAISEFSKVLKKGGKLVMVTPFFYPIHDILHDKYRFTEYGLREILDEGLSVEKIVPIGGMFSIPALLLHSIQKGVALLFPKKIRPVVSVIMALVLLPFSILGQLICLLDVLDKSGRFPIYYFTVARKK